MLLMSKPTGSNKQGRDLLEALKQKKFFGNVFIA
jgi:hypothetical protein